MTRAPTYPIHRNRRNSISIRFSVRSIRFSRCGPRAVGPRPPASLALGGKEIHYPPRGAESRGSSRSTGPPQPGGWPQGRERTVRGPAQGGSGGDARGALRDGRRTKHSNARRESWGRTGRPGNGQRPEARAAPPRTGRHHSRRADTKMCDTNSGKDRRKRISVSSQTRKSKAAHPWRRSPRSRALCKRMHAMLLQ